MTKSIRGKRIQHWGDDMGNDPKGKLRASEREWKREPKSIRAVLEELRNKPRMDNLNPTGWEKAYINETLSQLSDIVLGLKCEVPENKKINIMNSFSIDNINQAILYAGRYNYNKAIEDISQLILGG